MKDFIRDNLWFSLCGLNCGLCPMKLDVHCPGCGGGEGNQSCKIAKCSIQHGKLEYCSQCQEFPCDKYGRAVAFGFIDFAKEVLEDSDRPLKVYRAKDFQELIQDGRKIVKMDTDFTLRVLDHIRVFDVGMLLVVFLNGTEIECRSEEVFFR